MSASDREQPPPGPPPGPARAVALAVALVVATLAVYAQSVGFDFIEYDDPLYITDNPKLCRGLGPEQLRWAFTTFDVANWHPLAWISWMIDCELYGRDRPGGFHATNVLLHIGAVVMLFAFLLRATREVWPSVFVAAVFALHPLNAEAVVWIAERKLVLAAFFWMCALWFWAGWVQRRRGRDYALTLGAFALALLSKPTAVTLPCVLLLLDLWPFARRASGRLLIEKLPFFALSAAAAALTLAAQRGIGALETLERLGPTERLANAALAYLAYLAKAFWPLGLAVYYPHPQSHGQAGLDLGAALAATCALLAVSALAAVAYRRGQRMWLVGWLWFVGVLFPMSGIVQVGMAAMADRYAYLSLVGVGLALAFGVNELAKHSRVRRRVAAALAVAALCLLGGLAARQVALWRDTQSLFEHALAHTQANLRIHTNLAHWLERKGELEQARHHFERAYAIAPGHPIVSAGLAALYSRTGEPERARTLLSAALGAHPRDALLLARRGRLLLNEGDATGAFESFERALGAGTIRSYDLAREIHMGLGDAGRVLGRADALEHLLAASEIDPGYAKAHVKIAWLLATDPRHRDARRAREHFERFCAQAACDSAPAGRVQAAVLAAEGDFAGAERAASAALARLRNPDGWLAHELRLALARYRAGQAWSATASP